MFLEKTRNLKTMAVSLKYLVRVSAHGRAGGLRSRRHFGLSCCQAAKVVPRPKPRERVEIPGLQAVTYGERMHYVPGLAKPVYPPWKRDSVDPLQYRSPPAAEMPLYKETPCYVFNQRTKPLEGVSQALWLTKSQLIQGLPAPLLSSAEHPANQIPNQDQRVQDAIRHARFWDTTQERPGKSKYSYTLLHNLLNLCRSLQSTHSVIGRRILAEKYSLCASWKRGDNLFQVRGQNGLLQNCMDPLPEYAGKQEIASTADHVLQTFYPVSPTIDLQEINVYKEENFTGFKSSYPYPHAHTLYFLDGADPHCKLRPEQFRAKMIMFMFGNALARAHTLYGTQGVLDHPITVQAVGTNGRVFNFALFQLNTTDLSGDEGVKNQVWVDEDADLYEFAKVRPFIKRKEVRVPAGLSGYNPETFSKFLALYLHGAV
ncbi:large ribosomal subunit protein mL37 [Genypterus blacodes]|uniref:large ribosomal subunit protein mL37 n=1 Tax=Genypterus blacodes TaxID=154954 RepID=UPI003F75736F